MVCNLTRLGGRGQKTNQILQTSHKKSPHPQNCIDEDTPPYIATEAPSTESICSNPPRINESNLAPLCGEQPSSGGTSAAVDSARNGQSGFSVSGGTSLRPSFRGRSRDTISRHSRRSSRPRRRRTAPTRAPSCAAAGARSLSPSKRRVQGAITHICPPDIEATTNQKKIISKT